ncbi:reverse transcriptase domain-containing protein [Solemya velum gill symbiont]|uniref:reverse transcriptase domain-containing protein n=1 Tax=Solemya velum gill symbiont TaxID=2340 RepID=UPI0018A821A5|nr:reverse transcriptase domain-containing protein [Solemya velum gill symbiont]
MHRAKREQYPLSFKSSDFQDYNKFFSLHELQLSQSKSHNTAPGPGGTHYDLLKHLSSQSLELILDIFNYIWTSGSLPSSWKEATVIPIAKPGKDSTDPENYRPISLTGCLCKTMERMINDRLVWFSEPNNFSTNLQFGFRQGRSTIDHLVRLESYIRDAFLKTGCVVTVFFDLEKELLNHLAIWHFKRSLRLWVEGSLTCFYTELFK